MRDLLPSGSYLALSHATYDPLTAAVRDQLTALMRPGSIHGPFWPRTREQVTRLLTGTELVPPGAVTITGFRPDLPPSPDYPAETVACYAAIGRKP